MNILFQSTPFRVQKEKKQRFEGWFSLFQQVKKVELLELQQVAGECYQFISDENDSFFEVGDNNKTIEHWMEELASYLPDDEECWVLETAHDELTHLMTHQAMKITTRSITNHTLDEFVYRKEADTIENRYRRIFKGKNKIHDIKGSR